MTTDKNTAADWKVARRALAEAVRNAAPAQHMRRVEVPAPATDPLDWLVRQPAPRGFWKGREGDAEYAFTGVAERFEEAERLCMHLTQSPAAPPSLRYYGGVRFDAQRPAADGWQHFGAGAFVLPRVEVVRRKGEGTWLACHLAPGDDAADVAKKIERTASQPRSPSAASGALPRARRREDEPGRGGWTRAVQDALQLLGEGALQKVVLARRTRFHLQAPLDAVALLGRLRALAPEGFAFLFQPERAGAFVGISPERLLRQRGRHVQSEAVAGTRPRAAAAEDDAALRDELLQSEKDRREHAHVQRYVRDALRTVCTTLDERAAAPLTLRSGRHLHARLQGRLRESVTPAQVLRALHPTPAVGGVPVEAARRFIRAHEPFDRGWYAAPVGWVGVEEGELAAELAVGIRSGLVRMEERQLDLFAGAGLVEGSVPEKEWDEVEQKLGNFTALFSQ